MTTTLDSAPRAPEYIDMTPDFAGLYSNFASELAFDAHRFATKSTGEGLQAARVYFPILSICLEAAIGAQYQGDKGAKLRELSEHLRQATQSMITALQLEDPDAT